jgi:hypothetical protein
LGAVGCLFLFSIIARGKINRAAPLGKKRIGLNYLAYKDEPKRYRPKNRTAETRRAAELSDFSRQDAKGAKKNIFFKAAERHLCVLCASAGGRISLNVFG